MQRLISQELRKSTSIRPSKSKSSILILAKKENRPSCHSRFADPTTRSTASLTVALAFWILYFLCSAIRSNVGLAQTMNTSSGHSLAQVLHLSDKQTSTALALFYVAYVVFDFPSNLIMTRLSPRVWMSRIVFAVGLIGACFAAVKAAWSLL